MSAATALASASLDGDQLVVIEADVSRRFVPTTHVRSPQVRRSFSSTSWYVGCGAGQPGPTSKAVIGNRPSITAMRMPGCTRPTWASHPAHGISLPCNDGRHAN
jgi:hypothetical protein